MELAFSLLASLSYFFSLQQTASALHLQPHHVDFTQFKGEVSRTRTRNEIFHPPTGLCILRNKLTDPVKLGPCTRSDSWSYTPQNFLTIRGTYYCLQAVGPHKPVKLSIICTPSDSAWEMLPVSDKTYFATVLKDGTKVCLDVDESDNTVIANPCNGSGIAEEKGAGSEHDSQWFEFIKESKAGTD